MLTGINLVDRIEVPTERKLTDAGQMHVPCKFARTGTQLYTASQLGLVDKAPNEIVEVHRSEEQVFDEASIASFRSAPVTIGHPVNDAGEALAVSAENAKELQVGMLEGMPVRDEDTLGGTLILTNKEAIDALEDGTQELSAGYTCDIMEVEGKLFQQNIRANHIAIVGKGRAGSSCRISDEALEVQDAADEEAIAVVVADDVAPRVDGQKVEVEAPYTPPVVAAAEEVVVEPVVEPVVEAESVAEEAPVVEAEVEPVAEEAPVEEAVETPKKSKKRSKTVDEAVELTDADMIVKLTDERDASVALYDEAQKLIAELNDEAEKNKVELADARLAASEGVIERCEAIESARLIADMRDLGDKSVAEIKLLVVTDQRPEMKLDGKSEDYVAALFDMLVDAASGGPTPMQKLMDSQDSHVSVKAAYVNPVEAARNSMIARSKK